MQKARRHPKGLRPIVSARFQVLFHSLVQGTFHLSLTVLVRYRYLRSIQPYQMVLAVSDRVSRAPPYSGYCQIIISYVYGTITLFGTNFQNVSTSIKVSYRSPTTPILPKQYWFGLVRFRSPLLTESLLFSFPPGTQMFQFSGLASDIVRYTNVWVVPFGYLRIKRYLLLPATFRSLSRPSSPLRSQASTVRPYLLSMKISIEQLVTSTS